jgi:hypothetical protein
MKARVLLRTISFAVALIAPVGAHARAGGGVIMREHVRHERVGGERAQGRTANAVARANDDGGASNGSSAAGGVSC